MNKSIEELKELSLKCDQTSMLVMDAASFNKFFGKIYSATASFQRQAGGDSEELVSLACKLLDMAVKHHRENKFLATESAAKVFDETVKLLLRILSNDLNVNERTYQEARETRLKLIAVKACGIIPPGHYQQRSMGRHYGVCNNESEANRVEAEALSYAKDNLFEFTQFVYRLGKSQEYIPDPFIQTSLYNPLAIYERVISLGSGAKMIE